MRKAKYQDVPQDIGPADDAADELEPLRRLELGVLLRVGEIHMRALHQGRNLLKLIEGIILVVLNDAAEHLSQVAVQVTRNSAFVVAARVQLLFDFLQRFGTETHF